MEMLKDANNAHENR